MTDLPSAPAPIAVMSFNRPDYLEEVLTSLMRQEGCAIERRAIYLFQDGARNAISGATHARQDHIDATIATFQRLVQHGILKVSHDNLGVALNFDRAERWFFEELAAPAAIFLEDDLVLSENYISTLDRMIADYAGDARVGYVAAYGDHKKTLSEQRSAPRRLEVLHHLWGFATFKRQWTLMRPYVEAYLSLVKDVDYRLRDHEAIRSLYRQWGFGTSVSSQDAAKTLACVATATIKVNTRIVLGRYIGERGLHMNAAAFEKLGYTQTEIYDGPIEGFDPVDDPTYNRVMNEMRAWAGRAPKEAKS